ncbi:MAG: filamentous hemagglutinin N-terminal domain-containing protein [Gammaproteobacteria bacterium]|nr:filamentous hemagglutinin N-terminal domain-containing protein [Gammaproteobacteria bacterium]
MIKLRDIPLAIKLFVRFRANFLVAFITTFFTTVAIANPVLNNVAAGNVSVTQSPNTTVVNQASQRAILNWHTFNIAAGETTQFVQPNASSVALNRINPQQGASQIYGNLSANGKIILVNGAGIHFGPGAMVNVGGIIATTSDISNANFLNGKYIFDAPSSLGGQIINEGTIIAAQHGLVALLGSSVTNTGLIQAKLGSIALGSGDKFTLDFYGDQLINFSVDAPSSHGGSINNSGKLLADGGQVLVTARQAQGVLDNAINMSGVAQASSVHQTGGEIILDGGSGNVVVSGKLAANSAKGKGGTIKVLGNNILLKSTATIDANGQTGGGTILLGGNKQGIGPEQNALSTLAEAGSVINANAIASGNGGNVIVWSNNNTQFLGSISVTGGAEGGNGGLVETSGHYLNIAGAKINLSAPNGVGGTWLLDPADLTISTGPTANPGTFTPTYTADNNSNTSVVNVTDLTSALATGNVIIQTTSGGTGTGLGDITVATGIGWGSTNSLTLLSIHDIAINAPITTGAAGSGLILNAGGAITQTAAIGGSGNLTFQSVGTTILSQANTYTGTTTINSGVLSLTNVNALGSGANQSSGINVLSGATLDLNFGSGTLANSSPISLSSSTITSSSSNTILTNPITLSNVGSFGSAGTLTLTGQLTGSGNFSKFDSGTLVLSNNTNNYSGSTFLTDGTLQAGMANAFSPNSGVSFSSAPTAVLDLNNFNNSILFLSGFSATGAVTLGSGTLTLLGDANIGQFYTGNISGAGNLNLAGAYSQTLTGNNSYLGSTTIANGATLQIGGGGSTGTLSASQNITVTGFGTLLFSTTSNINVLGNISGTGRVQQGGSGTTQLLGNNTYSGATFVEDGTLQAGSATAISPNSSFQFDQGSINGGTLDLNGFNSTIYALFGNTGKILLGSATLTIQNAESNLSSSYGGVISGGGGLTLNTGANEFLTLTGVNTYTGVTMVNAGILQIGNGGTAGSLASASIVNNGGGLRFFKSGFSSYSGNISGTGEVDVFGGGIAQLSGNNTYSGNTFVVDGTLQAGSSTAFSPNSRVSISTGATLDLNGFNNTILTLDSPAGTFVTLGSGTLTIQNNIDGAFDVFRGVISGSGGVKFNMTGPDFPFQLLLGENTYSGPTEVVAGQLQIGGGHTVGSLNPSSNIIVDSGAALGFFRSDSFTVANHISGSGEVDLGGSGTTTFSGNNSYSGTTFIGSGGSVIANSSTSFGTSNVIVQDSASLILNNGITLANDLSITGTGNNGMGALAATGGLSYLTGAITLAGNVSINPMASTDGLYISGTVSGPFGLTQNGLGTLYLANTANTYEGVTTINSGTLVVSQLANNGVASSIGLGSPDASIQLGNGILRYDNQISPFTSATTDRAIQLNGNGAIQVVSGLLTLNGAIDGPYNLALTGPGSLQLGAAVGGTTALNSLTISNLAGFNINGGAITTLLNQTYNSLISGNPIGIGANTVLTSTGNGNITLASGVTGSSFSLTLAGGSGSNTFNIGGNLALNSINITGGSGNQNTMNFSGYVAPFSATLTANFIGTLANSQVTLGNFSNIQNIVGNSQGAITIAVFSKVNSIDVTGPMQGFINDPTNFSAFSTIVSPSNTQVTFANPGSVVFVNGVPYVNNVPLFFFNNNGDGAASTPRLFGGSNPPPPTPDNGSITAQQQSSIVQAITAQSQNNKSDDSLSDSSLNSSVNSALSFTISLMQLQQQMDFESLSIQITDGSSCS